ncbi:hypothetical protein HN011_012446 [Eciton burchellii]|nr:hypothetical protein HN011_012446 [Eciton burchellii]
MGVMSRRGRRRIGSRELANEFRNKVEHDQPDSPLLQNDSQHPTTSYASINSTDVTDHHVTFYSTTNQSPSASV